MKPDFRKRWDNDRWITWDSGARFLPVFGVQHCKVALRVGHRECAGGYGVVQNDVPPVAMTHTIADAERARARFSSMHRVCSRA